MNTEQVIAVLKAVPYNVWTGYIMGTPVDQRMLVMYLAGRVRYQREGGHIIEISENEFIRAHPLTTWRRLEGPEAGVLAQGRLAS